MLALKKDMLSLVIACGPQVGAARMHLKKWADHECWALH